MTAGDVPGQPTGLRPQLVETLSALLIFVADRVYKLKKPVDFGFLDFRTPAARRAACEAEVELNSRLAPDVYLGVADIRGPHDELWDSLVVMRRMPLERRLSTLVAADPDSPEVAHALAELGRLVATFHAHCATSPAITARGDPQVVRELWSENLELLRRHTGSVLDEADIARVEQLVMAYLDGRLPLLRRRQQRGLIRDGHGDLLADDIFVLDDGPRVLDCLDFNPRLRFGDVLNDAAFLAMDLERLGGPRLARDFLDAYVQFSGERHPRTLEHHYVAYRAGVRSKVSCLRWEQGDVDSAAAARTFSALALRHLLRGQVPLVLVGGLPGTGKSTVAAGLIAPGDTADWVLLRSDVIRKELAGLDPAEAAAAPYGAGLYQSERRRGVYAEMVRRAEIALGLGQGVIIDASFTGEEERAAARTLAARTSSPLIELECRARADAVVPRLTRRAMQRTDASDADVEIYRSMKREQAPWPSAQHIDTAGSVQESVASARAAVASALGWSS